MYLEYISGLNIPEDIKYSSATWSDDGKFLWVVIHNKLQIEVILPLTPAVVATLPPAAILYENVKGELKEITRVPIDPEYPFVCGGSSSGDFSVLTIAEENGLENRVRVFNLQTVPVPTGVITVSKNLISDSLTTIHGPKILNSKYTTISYLTESDKGEIAVIDLFKKRVKSRININGYCSTGGLIFRSNCVTYIVFNVFSKKSLLKVYKLNDKCIFMDELPTSVNSIELVNTELGTLIAVATKNAKYKNKVPPGDPEDLSNLTGGITGVRIYKLHKEELTRYSLITYNSGTIGAQGLGFSPCGNYLNVLIHDKIMATYKIKSKQSDLIQINTVPPTSYTSNFSKDGRWVIVSGGTPVDSDLTDLMVFHVC
jgi:hypothetical protein